MSYTCTSAGAALDASAVLSLLRRSSYVPWKTASTLMLLWLLLKPSTILLRASPLTPDIACHHTIPAAGLTSLPGAWALSSWLPPPPVPGVPPPHAATSIVIPSASAANLRICPSTALALDRTRGESSDELTLPEHEQGERRYGDHDDTRHDEPPAERLLEAKLRYADLRGAHQRLVRNEER